MLELIQAFFAKAEESKQSASAALSGSPTRNYENGKSFAYQQAAQEVIKYCFANNIELPNPIIKK